jgi:hypothetical protein
MNLESPAVSPAAIDAEHWQWMKNYRVWEANRKVFLYPENWIEPELRDDKGPLFNKTPFFKELETELLQNDVTMATAEQAFLNYLEKLDEVAQLEICGMCWQKKEDTNDKTDILHVFGRTSNTPRLYYYRRFLVTPGIWTPWEKVHADIQADHLIPVVYNRRLYLFWPIFEEKPDKEQTDQDGKVESEEHKKWVKDYNDWVQEAHDYAKDYATWYDRDQANQRALEEGKKIPWPNLGLEPTLREKPKEPPYADATDTTDNTEKGRIPPRTHLEIKLAWSVYKEGQWVPKQVSVEYVVHPANFGSVLPEQRSFAFGVSFDGETLHIEVNRADEYYDPYQYVWRYGVFSMDGCRDKVKAYYDRAFRYYITPSGSQIAYMAFEQMEGKNDLTIETYPVALASNAVVHHLLTSTPSRYRIVYPLDHQPLGGLFRLGDLYPFFYQDSQRSYSVMLKMDSPFLPFTTLEMINPMAAMVKYGQMRSDVLQTSDNGQGVPLHSDEVSSTLIAGVAQEISRGSAVQSMSSLPSRSGSMARVASRAALAGASPGRGGHSNSDVFDVKQNPAFAIQVDSATYMQFATFYHPHVCAFIKALNQKGIPGLLTLSNQQLTNDVPKNTVFYTQYAPTPSVHPDYPQEDVDFSHGSSYGLYNWELFFHIPLLIAQRLSQNQKFEEAQQWFHYIFNPTQSSGEPSPQCYWKVLPFYQNAHPEEQQIQKLLMALSYNGTDPTLVRLQQQVTAQVRAWQDHPFSPHLIASLRITAYQKTVVMKYIDNLIAWGDQLFSRDTIESINEATLLYILAANMLGPRPEDVPARGTVQAHTYATLTAQGSLDAFSNKLVDMENKFPFSSSAPSANDGSPGAHSLNLGTTFYFCIPKNDQLLGYWDTVADRLFKIRHCMNIEGVVRQLPLFEPPIDPALLVRATAMGVDLGSVLNDLSAPLPSYRFSYMVQKALELCAELKTLGGALLSALEKNDAEELAVRRVTHETALLRVVQNIKEQQIIETQYNREALQSARKVIEERQCYYQNLDFMNSEEEVQIGLMVLSCGLATIGQGLELAAAAAHPVPDQKAGLVASPMGGGLTLTNLGGGSKTARGLLAAGRAFSALASIAGTAGTITGLMGGYAWRAKDRELQVCLATKELVQIDKQIEAAKIRETIAQNERDNHITQIENAEAIEACMREKYTNQELYTWMVGEVSKVYFQSYKLAYDLAKRAERAYRFERGLTDSNFIQFGYWDSLKKGLLAGEKLHYDLKRLELAYLEQSKREYEITKHVSLVLHDPMALITLKETGQCEVVLSEALFDADYPGHYMRRLKSVSLTIPCVVGPYTSINCTLTLLSNTTRITSTPANPYPKSEEGEDARFVTNFAALQSIATSHAQNDSGMFELNFRDERYLPFEGAGAISRWRIDLPQDTNAFDFNTLSDVVLHLKYTAREGGEILKQAAKKAIQLTIGDAEHTPLARLFSLKHEFPTAWSRFLHPTDVTASQQTLQLDIGMERFPFQYRGKTITCQEAEIFLLMKEGASLQDGTPAKDHTGFDLYLDQVQYQLKQDQALRGILRARQPVAGSLPGTWLLEAKSTDISLVAEAIEDLFLLCHYTVTKTKSQ